MFYNYFSLKFRAFLVMTHTKKKKKTFLTNNFVFRKSNTKAGLNNICFSKFAKIILIKQKKTQKDGISSMYVQHFLQILQEKCCTV